MRHILFVCSQNKLRSPTAEAVFCDHDGWEVRSAGLNNDAEVPLGKEEVLWADMIFVMEQTHKQKLKKRFRDSINNQKIVCLGIPGIYDYMAPELVDILSKKVPQFVE